VTPSGGDAPSAPAGPEPNAVSGSTRSRGAQGVVGTLLVCLGALAMIGSIAAVSVFAAASTARTAPAPGPTSAPVPAPSAEPVRPPRVVDPFEAGEPAGQPRPELPRAREDRGSYAEHAASPLGVSDDDAVWGDRQAPATIVSFLDLECEYSRQLLPDLVRLKARFGRELRWVWKNRPLAGHAEGREAARVLSAIQQRHGGVGVFRFVVEAAYSEQPLSRAALERWAKSAGLDLEAAAEPVQESEAALRVERDVALGARFGVRATPVLFLNGIRLDGLRPLAELERAIARELATARWLGAGGMRPSRIYASRTEQNLLGVGEEAPSRECVPLEGSPSAGPELALVTIVQFSDYECAFCKQSAPVLAGLGRRFGGQLRMVWKSFPLPQHARARVAANFALAARAIGGDGAFWRVHELLLAEQGELDEATLSEVAARAGMGEKPLLQAAQSGQHDGAIAADLRLGKRLGVEGVPTFFVNGRRISGVASRAGFESTIADELASARKIAVSSAERGVYGLLCPER
jgi:protein-disulfide isomerase